MRIAGRSEPGASGAGDAASAGVLLPCEFTSDKVLLGVLTKKYGIVLQCEEDWRRPCAPRQTVLTSLHCYRYGAQIKSLPVL